MLTIRTFKIWLHRLLRCSSTWAQAELRPCEAPSGPRTPTRSEAVQDEKKWSKHRAMDMGRDLALSWGDGKNYFSKKNSRITFLGKNFDFMSKNLWWPLFSLKKKYNNGWPFSSRKTRNFCFTTINSYWKLFWVTNNSSSQNFGGTDTRAVRHLKF